MALISMKLVILGNIPLGIWIVVLSGPSDCVTHVLYNSHVLNEIDVEVVFKHARVISLCG